MTGLGALSGFHRQNSPGRNAMARYSDEPEREAYYAGWLDGKKGQEPDYRAFCELKDKVSDAVTKQAQKLREAGE